ncbi:SDR family NAD(P)-dependent oxidoreductase, partial [bacterium]|nr:SDR family NAD(P)-dependent oxidoreductase [bacterium]
MIVENKIIWITGASSGIGEELAKQLAAQGARLVLSARSEQKLISLRDALPGGAERHRVQPLDLAKPEQIIADGPALMREIGDVDVLINNAGVSQRSLFLETDIAVYRQLMEVDYLGLVALTKVVAPSMVERGAGSIIAISSVAGKVGTKLRTGYCGAKFAVAGFMESLRTEISSQGVHCLTVFPGYIQTQIALP